VGVSSADSREDLAYALKMLASGQTVKDAWKEAGFKSRKALADRIFRLAEDLEGKEPGGERKGVGKARGAGQAGRSGSGRAAPGSSLRLVAYSDGASIGNPGQAGCGMLLIDETGEVLLEDYRYLGRTTNNVAEYEGAILALKRARELGAREVELRVDSELIANQIMGRYKVKSTRLAHLYQDLKDMAKDFESFGVTLIKRSENKQADRLANLAVSSRKRR
jgi:ribonuclease HI